MRGKVLKAATLTSPQGSRRLDDTQQFGAPLAAEVPSGRWITDEALEQLCHEWHERGRAQAEADAQEQARQTAREAAAKEMGAQLEQLKAQLSRERAEQMKTLALALAQQLQALRDETEAQVADWTFVAVCRLLGELSPGRIQDTVRRLLAEAGMEAPVTVLLHPADHALVESAVAGSADARLQWRADAGIALGGSKLVGSQETLDARLETQLPLLRQALDDARREARGAAADDGAPAGAAQP